MILMKRYDINGVFYLMAVAALLLALVAAVRSMTSASPTHLERTFDILAPQAAPLAHDPVEPPAAAPKDATAI
jgi:hypothetical protein